MKNRAILLFWNNRGNGLGGNASHSEIRQVP
jgi:hypothetical protein